MTILQVRRVHRFLDAATLKVVTTSSSSHPYEYRLLINSRIVQASTSFSHWQNAIYRGQDHLNKLSICIRKDALVKAGKLSYKQGQKFVSNINGGIKDIRYKKEYYSLARIQESLRTFNKAKGKKRRGLPTFNSAFVTPDWFYDKNLLDRKLTSLSNIIDPITSAVTKS